MKTSHTSDGLKGTIIYYKIGIEMMTKSEPKYSTRWIALPPAQPITLQIQLQCHCSSAQNTFKDSRKLTSTQLQQRNCDQGLWFSNED